MSAPLPLRELLTGAQLVVVGGTGFLGKVWLSMLLDRFPQVGHIYLVVRPRKGHTPDDRFWDEIATSKVFDPLRAVHGEALYDFFSAKITPIAGDVSEPFGGVPQATRDQLRGRITALVNAAGVVDFNPPLDYALNVNAFGMQNLVALAHDLGDVPFLHTSTCYVAGDRTGQVAEKNPLEHPFPRANELDDAHWDSDREIAECVDLVEHVRHRTRDAFRQSAFLHQAKENLHKTGEPARGSALANELERVRSRYERDQLVQVGMERAKYWGWHNTYTYTKSIGEQVLAQSDLVFTIARPAIIESSVSYPVPGWNEGINTSSPMIYLALNSPGAFPGTKDAVVDIIPVDMVASGMLAALGELLEGTAKPVYHLGSSDANPFEITRLVELVGLYKRRHFRAASGNPLANAVKARLESTTIPADTYYQRGPRFLSRMAASASTLVSRAGGPLAPLTSPAAKQLDFVSKQLERRADVLDQFVPFMATHHYRFVAQNVRDAVARLSEQDRVFWAPETIDWHHWMLEVHIPGVQEHVFPQIEAKVKRPAKPLRSWDTLIELLDEAAERHDRVPALLWPADDGLERTSYRELRQAVRRAADALVRAGVRPGDRVLIAGANHPAWVIGWFAIVWAGAVAVPVAPDLERAQAQNIAHKAELALALLDEPALERIGAAVGVRCVDLRSLADGVGDGVDAAPTTADQPAAVLFTSGTTGDPKGVVLTHGNLVAMVGSLTALFPLRPNDRVLSVLPLHHTFEFTCGLLLPLARGARILYLDELSGDRLGWALREGRITAMVGVPALWQLLERRIRAAASDRGRLAKLAFDGGLALNRELGKAAGLDLGSLLFGSVHTKLGGNIRLLISGGAALPGDTHQLFAGLGLHLAEGYGLTEAAPVLAVARSGPGSRSGTVGTAIPGVQLRIANPDDAGVGEVLARGANVMQGYFRDPAATAAVIDADGWLHTGDLGRLNHKDELVLSGRAKDVVVTANGENVYLDDVESALGAIANVEEYALVGLPDGRGGERLGLLAVPITDDRSARDALQLAIRALPAHQRPAVVHTIHAPLPRTATRKVQRRVVRDVLSQLVAATEPAHGQHVAGPVVRAIAAISGRPVESISDTTQLVEDLGFDSLGWVELAAALAALPGHAPSTAALSAVSTVAEVIALTELEPEPVIDDDDEAARLELPTWLAEPAKDAIATAQMGLYDRLLRPHITGRAFIPANRPTLVVSNHASHLDMGLVKYALGPYGKRIRGLAAKDYFFEGNRWWVAWFEHLTNLVPLDREAGFRASFDAAKRVVDAGDVVLMFPEGTRREDGTLSDFKPLVGKLALETGVDILPLYLDGTHGVLPKGSMLPKPGHVAVRIGPPLLNADLRRLTAGLKPGEAARVVTRLVQDAVTALRDGSVLDLSGVERISDEPAAAPRSVDTAFDTLPARLLADRVQRPLSWYFSLGDEARFTVTVSLDGAQVRRGRPEGAADCVVKTTPEMMRRIINDAYLPGPPEFLSGSIKTNEIPLFIEFARVFALNNTLQA